MITTMKFDRLIISSFVAIVGFFALASIYNLTLQTSDLIRTEGRVSGVRLEKERDVKGRNRSNLYVYLNDGGRYKIMDDVAFAKYIERIVGDVHSGDSVVLYRRTSLQTTFGLGTSNLIYQLEKDGEVLMPLSAMKANFKFVLLFLILVTGVLAVIEIVRRKRIVRERGPVR